MAAALATTVCRAVSSGLMDTHIIGKRQQIHDVSLEDFELICMLGKGAYGKVFLAKLPNVATERFAIKVIRKDKLIRDNTLESVALEKEILFKADHPFLGGMDYLF